MGTSVCTVEGCSKPHVAKGLCGKHYQAQPHRKVAVKSTGSGRPCSVSGCPRKYHCKGFCQKHYAEQPEQKAKQAAGKAKRNAEPSRKKEKARYDTERYASDPLRAKANNKMWYVLNAEKHAANGRAWREANPSLVSAKAARRRALEANAEGEFSEEEWTALLLHFGPHCPSCGEIRPLTVDHVVPLSWGGSNWISNIQPLCRACNCRKRDLHATRYPRWEGAVTPLLETPPAPAL